MKNIFIQKIIKGKEVNNKPYLYLVTINQGIKLEEQKVMNKVCLLDYLKHKLS